MDIVQSKRILWRLALAYLVMVTMIFLIAKDGFHFEEIKGDALSPIAVVGELTDGMVLEQKLKVEVDSVMSVDIQMATFARKNSGYLIVELVQEDGTVLTSSRLDIATLEDGQFTHVAFNEPVDTKQRESVILRLTTEGCSAGNAVTVYYGNSVKAGRFDINREVEDSDAYQINHDVGAGMLCVYLSGVNHLIVYKIYWPIALGLFAVLGILCWIWWRQAQKGKNNPLVMFCTMFTRYGFLMRQLVGRDFKTKYKRSVLGVGWSVLNPLLTMAVQYVVFSTLFSNGTKNYPVYLLSGIVFFNFFSEAVSLGMTSITGNAALIKKVYMPKYIYPVSRVFSSLINLGTSMIPLLLVMIVTGIWPTKSFLLLIYDVICLVVFVIGMVLILSTSMTFFQDTQFLWSVISMIWMYMTPIFYTENIIPESLTMLYHMNPLYQYITFARICIIDGSTPGPMGYVWCLLSSCVVFALGVLIFKKNQDRFSLYL